jgi:hypothetical protein
MNCMKNAARFVAAWSIAFIVLAMCPLGASAGVSHSAFADVVTVLERFLMRSDEGPLAYRALRRLEAHNQHFGANAWMDVWTEADKAGGFRYQVAAQGGSGYIRRRVFLAALEGEEKMWREGEPKRAQLDHTNYSFREGGVADGGLASLAISPKRKDVLLINGWLFVKQEDGDLVRIEGQLSKNPSFWTRRVEIVRRYGRVGGVHVPLEIESVAQILIAGRSTFKMTYEYESVNGRHVGDPQPRVSTNDSDSAK